MIKAEMFGDKALLLDANGRVWEVRIGRDDQPEIKLLQTVSRDTVNWLMVSGLAQYVRL